MLARQQSPLSKKVYSISELPFVGTVSPRALIHFHAIFRSFDQDGIKPHRSVPSTRSLVSGFRRTMGSSWPGAALYRLARLAVKFGAEILLEDLIV